jgi:hypothetical protein
MNSLTLAGRPLQHFHVCAFFNSRDEEYEVLTPFFEEGIANGEKNVHLVNPDDLEEHRKRLDSGGIDVALCEACGQLEIVPWSQAYLEGGTFDRDRMLNTLDQLTGQSEEGGYKRLRIMGNMDWASDKSVDTTELIAYEAEVNDVLARNKQPAVCVYDISKVSGEMMMDVLRTHPLTLVGGVLKENPFYTPAAQLLQEGRSRP